MKCKSRVFWGFYHTDMAFSHCCEFLTSAKRRHSSKIPFCQVLNLGLQKVCILVVHLNVDIAKTGGFSEPWLKHHCYKMSFQYQCNRNSSGYKVSTACVDWAKYPLNSKLSFPYSKYLSPTQNSSHNICNNDYILEIYVNSEKSEHSQQCDIKITLNSFSTWVQ